MHADGHQRLWGRPQWRSTRWSPGGRTSRSSCWAASRSSGRRWTPTSGGKWCRLVAPRFPNHALQAVLNYDEPLTSNAVGNAVGVTSLPGGTPGRKMLASCLCMIPVVPGRHTYSQPQRSDTDCHTANLCICIANLCICIAQRSNATWSSCLAWHKRLAVDLALALH